MTIKDPHYRYPGDDGYPTGGPAASLKLAVPNPDNPPVQSLGTVIVQSLNPALLRAAREYRVALSVWGASDPRTTEKANTLTGFAEWGVAFQAAGGEAFDGTEEAAIYVAFGGQ